MLGNVFRVFFLVCLVSFVKCGPISVFFCCISPLFFYLSHPLSLTTYCQVKQNKSITGCKINPQTLQIEILAQHSSIFKIHLPVEVLPKMCTVTLSLTLSTQCRVTSTHPKLIRKWQGDGARDFTRRTRTRKHAYH